MTLLAAEDIQERLRTIFPEGTENRNYLVRELAARTVFVCLYANAVEGMQRWIRPSQVYRMTSAQALLQSTKEREEWFEASRKSRYAPKVGSPWYADNTREPIRDETLRDGFIAVGAIVVRTDVATTSSEGRYALQEDFAALFGSTLTPAGFQKLAQKWREDHLSKQALARQHLVATGAVRAKGSIQVSFPNGETRNLAAGPSSVIAKAVVEEFAPRFLKVPHVLWLSESGNKVIARDERLAAKLGINIDPAKALPDLILVDLGQNAKARDFRVVFTEVVATDGAINRQRKDVLKDLALAAGFEEANLAFLTAFMDKSTPQFRKLIVEIAWGTYVWLVAEPDSLIDMRDGKPTKLSDMR